MVNKKKVNSKDLNSVKNKSINKARSTLLKKSKTNRGIGWSLLIVLLLVGLLLIQNGFDFENQTGWDDSEEVQSGQIIPGSDGNNEAGGILTIHCLDVGQASATLLVSGEHAMLVDAGNRDDRAMLVTYLQEQGISELDYLLLTHPHEDHIGSASEVIREIGVDRVIMPDITIDECETAVYADLQASIEEKQPILDTPHTGDVYSLGEASFTIIGPSPNWVTDTDNFNESSIGILITNGENRIVIYGDGEKNCENYMVENFNVNADLLIVGHHGSSTSSSEAFLEEVSPDWAVISCGVDNKYGFPHEEVLNRLSNLDSEVFRTDILGTIIFTGDGKKIMKK